MKKNDMIIILLIIGFALVVFGVYNVCAAQGSEVCIYIDGREYGRYDLKLDQTIDIQGTNILEIKNGEAKMKEADCPDELCIHQRAISKNRESIICLPNKISVEIISEEEKEYDAIVQ